MKRVFRIAGRVLKVILLLIIVIGVVIFFYVRQPQFGALPEGQRLEQVQKSPFYKDGQFRNLIEKPTITPGYSISGELWKMLTKDYPRREPVDSLPSVKTDLKSLPADSNVFVWFGHSSFYMQIDGVKILVDPVFSGKASPLPWGVKSYKGSDIYSAADLPSIDYMLLSHDHYDHLDYETAEAMRSKVKYVICGLGAGAHYERWGYKADQIIEKDWYEKVEIKQGFNIYTDNTHHTTGRGFTRDQSQWLSFIVQSPHLTVYYSGDGGHTDRFTKVAEKFPSIDWAIMECGQYNKAWQSVHELPNEVADATVQLKAKNLIPVHNSKFTLANHPWDEPLSEMARLAPGKPYRLVTPMIGELVRLSDSSQVFTQWWKGIE